MKVFSVNPKTKEIEELDIKMEANTVYSFFNSILVDEIPSIKEHIIYTDANALSNREEAYFIGEQLVVGKALIVGVDGMSERDVTIPKDALASIVNYDVTTFYKDILELLSNTNINLYRAFEVTKDDEKIALNVEWVLYTFDIADERTRVYFKTELKRVIDEDGDVEAFIQKMAQLAMNVAS